MHSPQGTLATVSSPVSEAYFIVILVFVYACSTLWLHVLRNK